MPYLYEGWTCVVAAVHARGGCKRAASEQHGGADLSHVLKKSGAGSMLWRSAASGAFEPVVNGQQCHIAGGLVPLRWRMLVAAARERRRSCTTART